MAKKILVIEDEPIIMMAMKTRLNLEGYEVLTAPDGKSGIEAAEKKKPDVIVLDIMLPDIDGFTVCDTIKNRKKLKVKIVMVTSKIDAVDATKARKSGADDFTVKTTNFEAVLSVIKKLL